MFAWQPFLALTHFLSRLSWQLRQQYSNQWTRRTAIDSERERDRALLRDRALARENNSANPSTVIPHDHANPGASPRPAYWDEVQGDPQRIGFAYGGVYPGRLHAKGQLVEAHEVHFSVGVCGSYLLYVSLRQPHTPWSSAPGVSPRGLAEDWQIPGSPFTLQVFPGAPYALTTQIPSSSLPLRGGPEANSRVFACELVLVTRDKMSNVCDKGGASVTCGFVDSQVMRHEETNGASAPVADSRPAPTGGAAQPVASIGDCERSGTVSDNGDGTYRLKWISGDAGLFEVFVKLDGLHVLGSPAKMILGMVPSQKRGGSGRRGGATG